MQQQPPTNLARLESFRIFAIDICSQECSKPSDYAVEATNGERLFACIDHFPDIIDELGQRMAESVVQV